MSAIALGLILLFSFLLSGCATGRVMTQSEALQATTRTYTHTTGEKILQAARKVFELADEPDFKFYHTPTGLTATRKAWTALDRALGGAINPMPDVDTWNVDAQAQPGLTRVTVSVVRQGTRTSGGGFINNVYFPGTTSKVTLKPKGPAVYRLFFTRLEYLLDQQVKWPTCPEFEERMAKDGVKGELFWLCEYTAEDDLPVELRTPQAS